VKIAIIYPDYHSRGGVERVVQFLARGLSARRHQVDVWCRDAEIEAVDSRIRFNKVRCLGRSGPFMLLSFACKTAREVAVNSYDAVVTMGAASLAPNTIIIANSVHLHWYRQSRAQLKPSQLRWWLKVFNPLHRIVISLEKAQYKFGRYKHIIAASQPIKTELNKLYEIPLSDIEVLPNGADVKKLVPEQSARLVLRRQLGLSEGDELILFAANEFERKGLRQILDSLVRIPDPRLKLLVISRADPKQFVELSRRLGILERVTFLPATSDLHRYMWASDLFVMPTQYEAWSLAIVEAQAAGLPVITTRLGSADTVIDHGVSGFLLDDPFDVDELTQAIQSWRSSPSRDKMSSAALERAGSYAWDKILDGLENILRNIVK